MGCTPSGAPPPESSKLAAQERDPDVRSHPRNARRCPSEIAVRDGERSLRGPRGGLADEVEIRERLVVHGWCLRRAVDPCFVVDRDIENRQLPVLLLHLEVVLQRLLQVECESAERPPGDE